MTPETRRSERKNQASASNALRVSGRQRRRLRQVRRRCDGEHLCKRRESKVHEQPVESRFSLVEIAIVTESAHRAGVEARLSGIDLPRMQIENRGLPLVLVDPRDAPACPAVRKKPEITATGDGKIHR